MADISKVAIGACKVTLGGVDLGHTLDGVEIEIERETTELTVDQYGTTPVDIAITGTKGTVKLRLAEPDANRLNSAYPEGLHTIGAQGERVGIGVEAGYLLRADAKELVLRPFKNVASANDDEDVVFYKVVSNENVALNFKVDEQRAIEVTFTALADPTYGNGRLLGHIGSTTIS